MDPGRVTNVRLIPGSRLVTAAPAELLSQVEGLAADVSAGLMDRGMLLRTRCDDPVLHPCSALDNRRQRNQPSMHATFLMNNPVNPNKALWEKGDFTRIAESMRESGVEKHV